MFRSSDVSLVSRVCCSSQQHVHVWFVRFDPIILVLLLSDLPRRDLNDLNFLFPIAIGSPANLARVSTQQIVPIQWQIINATKLAFLRQNKINSETLLIRTKYICFGTSLPVFVLNAYLILKFQNFCFSARFPIFRFHIRLCPIFCSTDLPGVFYRFRRRNQLHSNTLKKKLWKNLVSRLLLLKSRDRNRNKSNRNVF